MADTLLFIDTNILLDFYRAPQSDLSLKVFDLLLRHTKRLIISDQVEIEFKKNRQTVIEEYIKHLPIKIKDVAQAPVLLSNTPQARSIRRSAEALQSQLVILEKKLKDILSQPENHDEAYKKIMPLFNIESLFNYRKTNIEISDKIFSAAIKRFHRGMPPRKKDDLSIGDALNWEWCLYCCSLAKKFNLIILSRDGDFAENPKDHHSPINHFLEEEFKARIGNEFSVKLERSLKNALKEINIKLTKQLENELDHIQTNSEEYDDYLMQIGRCKLCSEHALFDAYCTKCGDLIVGDGDNDIFTTDGNKVYEWDDFDNARLIRCSNCKNARMKIEYQNYCDYCKYKWDKAFDED